MAVYYEWGFETHDDDGEIIDTNFTDKLADLPQGERGELVLVRNEGSENAGLTDRLWAYVKDGKLPECFNNGISDLPAYKVPQRFHKELAAYLKH